MNYLLLIFIAVDAAQCLYIRWLKKEIALRDGTYKPKVSILKRFFKRRKYRKYRLK